MQLINKHNFFPTVCEVFAFLVLVKVFPEAVTGKEDSYYIGNLLCMFIFTFMAILVLGLHYYLQDLPMIPVVLGQYVILMVLIHGGMHVYAKWFGTQYAPTGYRDIFISFTIPYVIGAIAYYMVFFRECTKANRMIRDLKSSME